MGKIDSFAGSRASRRKGRPSILVIFDAPATGHGLAFFGVPKTAMSMTRMGPLHAKAKRMWRLLTIRPHGPQHRHAAGGHAGQRGHRPPRRGLARWDSRVGKVVVNGVYPDFFPDEHDELRRMREEALPSWARRPGRARRARPRGPRRSSARGARGHDRDARPRPAQPAHRPAVDSSHRGSGPTELETLADRLEAFRNDVRRRTAPASASTISCWTKQVIVCVGSGGVGKTTMSAAIALKAAELGRRVCVSDDRSGEASGERAGADGARQHGNASRHERLEQAASGLPPASSGP